MKSFFDYLFYRYYRNDWKKDSRSVVVGAIAIGSFYFALSAPITLTLLDFFITEPLGKYDSWCIAFIFFVPTYFYYKKRVNEIERKYKHSKYNKIFPNYIFWLIGPIFWIIGAFSSLAVKQLWFEPNFERGELGRYLLTLFS